MSEVARRRGSASLAYLAGLCLGLGLGVLTWRYIGRQWFPWTLVAVDVVWIAASRLLGRSRPQARLVRSARWGTVAGGVVYSTLTISVTDDVWRVVSIVGAGLSIWQSFWGARSVDRSTRSRWWTSGLFRRLPLSIAELAASLAGPRRASDAEAWRAHLLGDPDRGVALTRRQQWSTAVGFLFAAGRMRWNDLCRQMCRPADWIVASEVRIAKFVVTAGVVAGVSLHQHGGWARVWDDFEQLGVLVGVLSGACYGWRRLRGIDRSPG